MTAQRNHAWKLPGLPLLTKLIWMEKQTKNIFLACHKAYIYLTVQAQSGLLRHLKNNKKKEESSNPCLLVIFPHHLPQRRHANSDNCESVRGRRPITLTSISPPQLYIPGSSSSLDQQTHVINLFCLQNLLIIIPSFSSLSFPGNKHRHRRMGRAPCCDKNGLKKGPWTPEEDDKLNHYIQLHGPGNWRNLPKNAGNLIISLCIN